MYTESIMEVYKNEKIMQCFKIKIPCHLMRNMKISSDITNSKIVLWSKCQLVVYENLNFRENPMYFETEFEIEEVIALNNCLVCLDRSGNVNIDTIQSFSIWKPNIKCICACEIMCKNYLVSLQFEERHAALLVNELSMNDCHNESHGLKLKMPNEDWMSPGKSSIMVCSYIKSEDSKRVKSIYNVGEPDSNYLTVIISLDKRNVYAVLFPSTIMHNELLVNTPYVWVNLYKTHTDIIDIKIIKMDEIYVIIGLAGGNIVQIPLLLKNQKSEVYHLNSTINKFSMKGNTIIYTDVLTMWKHDMFSKSDPIFEQFVVKNISDFCFIGNQVICVTFSNLIYSFNITDRSSYIKPPDTDYSCAAQLVTNSDCLKEIMEIIREDQDLLKKINKESEYLMALSLSKRQDIMDELIQVSANVYDDYRDLASKTTDLTLTDKLDAYYDSESYYFLINILVNRVQHKLNKLLSDVLDDIKIHITLLAPGILKTTSIQIKEQLTTKNFVVSLKRKNQNIRRMQIHVKIITNVPGKFDENQKLWTILYQKCIDLKAETFINMKTSSNSALLKEDETPLEMLIYKRAKHLHGTEYKFLMSDYQRYEWTLIVKLPNCNLKMEDILKLIDPFYCKMAQVSLTHLMKASKGKNLLEFQVGKELVKLNIESGNLKVSCPDIIVATEIRNFFSNIIFTSFKSELGKELIDHKYYTSIENLKRDINRCNSKRISTEEFATLLTRFLRNVYCLIPI